MLAEVLAAAIACASLTPDERSEIGRPFANLREGLHDEQRALYDCEDPIVCTDAGRRSGKTRGLVAKLLHHAERSPGRTLPYLALTAESAEHIAWPVIRELVQMYGLGTCSDATLTAHIYNGAQIVARGTANLRHVEVWRGPSLPAAVVDECGSQPPDLLRKLVYDILQPALGDVVGSQLLLGGTPPPIIDPESVWVQMAGPSEFRRGRQRVFSWDLRRNPYFRGGHGEAFLAEIRELNGWAEDHPTYLREWLGQWTVDKGSLVIPYSPEMNGVAGLPSHNDRGLLLAPSLWSFVIAIDIGYVNATAIAVLATHPHDQHDYVCSTEKHVEWISGQLANRLGQLDELEIPIVRDALRGGLEQIDTVKVGKYAPVIADLGGLGVQHAEEIARHYGIRLEPATKTDKESVLRFTRDRVRGGLVKVLAWALCDPIRGEWAVLGWDKEKRFPAKGQQDHSHDSVCYGLRRGKNYTAAGKPKGPAPGTDEWYRAEALRLEREAEERAARNDTTPSGWYR